MKLTSTDRRSAQDLAASGCIWWLQQLGGRRQRGKLVGVMAVVGLVAVVVAGAGWLIINIDEAEWRICDLGGCGRPCSRRMILPSSRGSCAPLPQAFRTLGDFMLAYSTPCARTCAVTVAALPLW